MSLLSFFLTLFLILSQVDLALPVGAQQLPRPWSKLSRGSSGFEETKVRADIFVGASNDQNSNVCSCL